MDKENSEKKVLVSLETVLEVSKIPKADRLVACRVLGYTIIVDPTSFGFSIENYQSLVGTNGVFFYPDGVVPEALKNQDCFSYLQDSHMGKRIRTIKLKGQYSEGLFLPLKTVGTFVDSKMLEVPVGTDLTSLIGIQKYYPPEDTEFEYTEKEKKEPREPRERNERSFPLMFPKTDQPHQQKHIHRLEKARTMVATLKIDGQSATFFYDPETKESGICSRNLKFIKDNYSLQFAQIEHQYKILQKLETLGRPLAIRGEIFGGKINGNRLKCTDFRFLVFDVYTWTREEEKYKGHYLPHSDTVELCRTLQLPMVPVVVEPTADFSLDVQYWLDKADKLNYDQVSSTKGLLAEGLVLKTCDDKFPYISCKVISRAYSVKHNLN